MNFLKRRRGRALPFIAFKPNLVPLEQRLAPAVTMQFDYSFDTHNFFTQERRDALEFAGNYWGSRLQDTLAAITPGGANQWEALVFHPSQAAGFVTVPQLHVPANTLIIYAGAFAIPGGAIGLGGAGGYNNLTGSQTFINTVDGRQTFAIDPLSDFGPWGGAISFDTNTNWFFGINGTPGPGQSDFISTALHELGHLLGFDSSTPSFGSKIIAGNRFNGANAVAAFGGTIPLSGDSSHWADGTMSDGVEALMNAAGLVGTRNLPTSLDLAAMRDIGWQIAQGNANPVLVTNNPLAVNSGATATITNTVLRVTDADHPPAQLVFTVQTAPQHGTLTLNGNPTSTFTQADIDQSLVRYVHGGNGATSDSFVFTVSDGAGGTIGATTFNVNITSAAGSIIVLGADQGSPPLVRVLDAATRAEKASFLAYGSGFLGGVRVATGDVNQDGVPDIFVAAGPGAGPHIKIFDGQTFEEIASFWAFDPPTTPGMPFFDSGMFIAAGDVDGDGRADAIVGADAGGLSHFKVFHMAADGARFVEQTIVSQFAFELGFNGGVRVAAAELNGDAQREVAIAAGPGAGPHVKVFRYNGTQTMDEVVSDWAFQPPTLPGVGYFDSGMYIAAGDIDSDGITELFVGAGAEAGPHAKIFRVNGSTLEEIDSFFAFDAAFRGGIRLGALDLDGDGRAHLLVGTGPGTQARGKIFRSIADYTREEVAEFTAFPDNSGGVFIAGSG